MLETNGHLAIPYQGQIINVNFDDLANEVQKLSAEERLEFLKVIMPSPLQVVLGGTNQISGSIIVQINMADRQTVADVLDAVRDCLRRD